MVDRFYYVYMLTSSSRRVLYTGVTNNLAKRLSEHLAGESEFTAKYKAFRLVYYESYQSIENAINREKQIKSWKRFKKDELVQTLNPTWKDLGKELGLLPQKELSS